MKGLLKLAACGLLLILASLIFLDYKNNGIFTGGKENNKTLEINAETVGSSPESGATSKLKSAYDFLVSKGTNYGDSKPSDWIYPSYGTYWNRILYAASWEPDGTATEADVVEGATFYSGSNNRVQQTGRVIDYSKQSLIHTDDYGASDETGEEPAWINTNSSSGNEVWYDTRTSLYWARSQPAALTNNFVSPAIDGCPFFTTDPRGNYGTSSTDPDCGDAINACAVLSLASQEGSSADTDWYLPSQKELQQAYVDGIYNQTSSSFCPHIALFASTENDDDGTSYAVYRYISNGYGGTKLKSTATPVKCVRRD